MLYYKDSQTSSARSKTVHVHLYIQQQEVTIFRLAKPEYSDTVQLEYEIMNTPVDTHTVSHTHTMSHTHTHTHSHSTHTYTHTCSVPNTVTHTHNHSTHIHTQYHTHTMQYPTHSVIHTHTYQESFWHSTTTD